MCVYGTAPGSNAAVIFRQKLTVLFLTGRILRYPSRNMEYDKQCADALLTFARTGKKDSKLPPYIYSSWYCATLIGRLLSFAGTKDLVYSLFRELSAGGRFGDSPSHLHTAVLALTGARVELDYV